MTTTTNAQPSHVADAIYQALRDYRGIEIQDGDVEYTLDLVADDWEADVDDATALVTAWTEDGEGEDHEIGTFRVTITPEPREN